MTDNIIDCYGKSVYRLALAITKNPDTAQDIYQQTFLLLLEKKPVFYDNSLVKIWLLKTARKLCSREMRIMDNNNLPLESAPECYTHDEYTAEFLDVLSTLDESYVQPVVLFYIEDMSVADIAKTLGISKGSVKTRLHRARCCLEKLYKEELI